MLKNYIDKIESSITKDSENKIETLIQIITKAINNHNNIFICGNGGSAANSIHIANDFTYMNNKIKTPKTIKIESLASNAAVMTCIANDISYEDIFSFQIMTKAEKNDLLIILSGSGNSKNIIKAIELSKMKGLNTFGLIGFDGGKAKEILDEYIHFNIDDMQVVEDLQTIVFHYIIKKIF